MDSYLYLYTNKSIEIQISLYIGWNELRNSNNISDNIWKRICEDYCQDPDFEQKFNAYWIPECRIGATYKELFLCFISAQIKILYKSFEKYMFANILLKSRDFGVLSSKHCPRILCYLNSWLLSDKEIVFNTIKQDISALRYINQDLKMDKEFMLLIERYKSSNISILNYVDDSLKSDKEWIIKLVKISGRSLALVDAKFQRDADVVLNAVLQEPAAFQFAHDSLISNKSFVLKLVSKRGTLLIQHRYVSVIHF